MSNPILRIILLYLIPMRSIAAHNAHAAKPLGIGQVASNLMEPVNVFSDFILTGCFIIGASFLFASLIKYIEHRRSPLMVPIGTVIFLLVAGILLILLPFLSLLLDNGIPYSLMK